MKKEIHGGWKQVINIFLIVFSIYAITYNTTGLFIDPVSKDLNISRFAMNSIITLQSMGSLLVYANADRLFNKFGIKKLLIGGCLGCSLTLFLCSFVGNIYQMYILYFFMGISIGLVSDLSFTIIISNWFRDRASMANGLALMGTGIGGALFSYIAGLLMKASSWRLAYGVLGLLGLGLSLIPAMKIVVGPDEKEVRTGQAEPCKKKGYYFSF